VPPVSRFEVNDLSDVVVLAGRNGVGKTRLIQAVVRFFRNPANNPNIRLVIEATSASEKQAWGQATIDTAKPAEAQRLLRTLQQSRRRASLRSSVLQFESDRSIRQIQPYAFTWDFADPWDENYGWDGTFGDLSSRFQDTLHSIFRKVRSHREGIARTAEQLRRDGATSMPLDWQDPLAPFKTAFRQLLAPKELIEADLQGQKLVYQEGDARFPVDSLSSGEREVVNIVFDFILRNPEDCVVFFDEPELHLHPELSYKLLQTLRNVGTRNQFVFCTHSPDIITASLDQSVVFVGPPSNPPQNQALPVAEQDETNQALRLLGQSVGIIALGKRIVLIEGSTASLDKQVYGSILRERFPDLVLVPAGGKALITSFSALVSEVLEKAIWGVEFFMLCDRDAVPFSVEMSRAEAQASGRLRVLPRYHLENYFLDPGVLAAVFAPMDQSDSWLRDPSQIDAALVGIARQMASYAVALTVSAHFRVSVGNLDIMPKGCHGKTCTALADLFTSSLDEERLRIDDSLKRDAVLEMVATVAADIERKLASGDDAWKTVIPGRPVLNAFAAKSGLGVGRLKQLYVSEASKITPSPFADIVDVFEAFSSATR